MRAALYVRVSSEDQVENTSLDDQERICRKYAEVRGWRVVELYREEGFTGTKAERPEWDRLMRDARADLFDVVVVMNWKRFARNARVGLNLSFELEDMGVGLAVTEVEIDTTTKHGRFLRLQFLGLAELDRDSIVEQLAKGQYAKARAGGWPGGDAPYGYRLEGHGRDCVAVVDEDEAEMLRQAVAWILDEGETTGTVAAWLNAQGYRQRKGGPWGHQNLRRVLTSEKLKGVVVWGKPQRTGTRRSQHQQTRYDAGKYYGEPTTIQLEPIISATRWDALQAVLTSRGYGTQTGRKTYPLGGPRLLSPCGANYGGVYRSDRDLRQYRCKRNYWNAKGEPRCDCLRLTADDIESRVWGAVAGLLANPDQLMRMASDYLALRAGQVATEREELERVEGEIAKLERRLATEVVEYIRAGVAPSIVRAATEAIEGDLATLRRRREDLGTWSEESRAESEKVRELWGLAERAHTRFDSMSLEERAEVMALLDVTVQVGDNTYEPPLTVSGVVPWSAGDSTDETPRYLAGPVTAIPFRLPA